MAKTAAERQREYRKRRPYAGENGDGEMRINTWVSSAAVFALRRLARHHRVTQRQMLEQLIEDADERIRKRCKTDAEFNEYLGVTA